MGWASAGEIFDPVCRELKISFLHPATRKKILVTLIKALQAGDWDTEDESLDQFADDAVVVAAFRECGVELLPPVACACTGLCGGFGCGSSKGRAYMEGKQCES